MFATLPVSAIIFPCNIIELYRRNWKTRVQKDYINTVAGVSLHWVFGNCIHSGCGVVPALVLALYLKTDQSEMSFHFAAVALLFQDRTLVLSRVRGVAAAAVARDWVTVCLLGVRLGGGGRGFLWWMIFTGSSWRLSFSMSKAWASASSRVRPSSRMSARDLRHSRSGRQQSLFDWQCCVSWLRISWSTFPKL